MEEKWEIITCPSCNGKRRHYVEYEDEWDSGYERCYSCDGQGQVKVNLTKRLNELKEWP